MRFVRATLIIVGIIQTGTGAMYVAAPEVVAAMLWPRSTTFMPPRTATSVVGCPSARG